MPKRVEKKEPEVELTKFKKLFTRSRVPFWGWFMGTGAGICLIYFLLWRGAWDQKVGMAVVAAVFVFILSLYLLRFYEQLLGKKYLILSLILILTTLLMGKIVMWLPQIPNVFIPIAFLSILFSLFFNFPLSLIASGMLSTLLVLASGQFEIIPVLLCGGMVGAYSAPGIHQRTDITKVGGWVGLANLLSIIGVGLIEEFPLSQIAVWGLWGIGSGIFSSILVTMTLPYFETYVGITTDIRLLELTDLNHPLLRRLSIEAPGTYHHTIMVATLAVAAAEAVGANPLLAKVGAYYHDVGKILRPHFFFENSKVEGRINDYHSRVSPNLSSMIITSHVKDGIELAKIYRLPQQVLDIITQHHGTSLIAYFYRKALLRKRKEDSVEEFNFRYPGPRPNTKESVIVMLADSVEADSRFSFGKSHKEIASQVRKVIDNKLKDHQLAEADLTLKDLTRISEAFTRVLTGLSHIRGRYPEEMLESEEGSGPNQQYVGRENSRTRS